MEIANNTKKPKITVIFEDINQIIENIMNTLNISHYLDISFVCNFECFFHIVYKNLQIYPIFCP